MSPARILLADDPTLSSAARGGDEVRELLRTIESPDVLLTDCVLEKETARDIDMKAVEQAHAATREPTPGTDSESVDAAPTTDPPTEGERS